MSRNKSIRGCERALWDARKVFNAISKKLQWVAATFFFSTETKKLEKIKREGKKIP